MQVYFSVHKNQGSVKTDTPIPFETVRFNVGAAMNIHTGTFTAPRKGRYLFSFSTIVSTNDVDLVLCLNGAVVESVSNSDSTKGTQVTTVLEVRASDKVWLSTRKKNGKTNPFRRPGSTSHLFGSKIADTFFTGWLVDEDLW